ncbi:MAG TPA: YbfB/YjiJ family MFS transporter [Acetobacteraceae bacterium]
MRWHAAMAGLAASLVGIGLGRFAYTPLIPALVGAHWFPATQVVYLGAANLAGYLAGALVARRLAAAASARTVLRGMMVLASLSFFACAAPISVGWYFAWRFAAGAAGGVIMVLAAPTILPVTDPARRGLVGGMIFTGVGLGIAASGTLVPLLLQAGLPTTWCGLGVLALVLTVIAWGGWPAVGPQPARANADAAAPLTLGVGALLVEYGLNAAGLVPHMVFLVDFIARGLGAGLAVGGFYWVVFGLGAMAGPLLAGAVADRIGFAGTLRLGFLIESLAVLLPALTRAAPALLLSSAVAGAFTPGVVPLVLGRVHELLPGDPVGQRVAWSWTTIAFALFQAAGAYLYSFLFARSGGDYAMLFAIGTGALALALAIELAVAARVRVLRVL